MSMDSFTYRANSLDLAFGVALIAIAPADHDFFDSVSGLVDEEQQLDVVSSDFPAAGFFPIPEELEVRKELGARPGGGTV